MKTFQLDQNLDSRKVVQACNDEGHAGARRLPPRLRDTEDPDLLAVLMAEPAPLVTLDRRLPRDHSAHIPDANPGIVVVTNYPRKYPTMTSVIATRILGKLKASFPAWSEAPLNNSLVEITAEGVEVCHVLRGSIVRDGFFSFADADWQTNLLAKLRENAGQGPAMIPTS
jgi:hypothetical protein